MTINTETNLSPLKNLRQDIPAGIAVFLVALPLCLGIALASGAPLISGMIAGIIGGLVVGSLSNSSLGVSGPAAGLTVLVLNGIDELTLPVFLMAIIFAGILQIILSFLKAGIIGYYFPSAVISGMLFGIGVIIILKQIPHAMGYDRDYEGDLNFKQADGFNTFTELEHVFNLVSPTAIVIALVALTIMILWETKWISGSKYGKLVPGSLLAVTSGLIINQVLLRVAPEMALSGNHLVLIPHDDDYGSLFSHLTLPDYTQWQNIDIYITGIVIALVASLETLLCVEATDKQDPHKRSTDTNKELFAQGVGNVLSGCIGGIPVTQVIVRSSANAQAGGQTKTSTIFHGSLLLLSILVIPGLLNMIPLATLATILIIVGYKLAHPSKFIALFKSGIFHFIPFIATVLGLVFTDLLTGVTIGSCIAIFSILLENYRMGILFQRDTKGNLTIITLAEHVSFLSKANIQQALLRQPPNTELIIDALAAKFIDFDVREIIDNFKIEAKDKNIDFKFIDMQEAHPVVTKDLQQGMTPDYALHLLIEGNKRFVNNLHAHGDLLTQVNITSSGQYPFAIILSCIDSRTSAELIFDQGLGDIFSVRIAGNVINEDILGSMEFACKVAGSKLIMVLGHSKCGAVLGACEKVELENLTGLLGKITPAIEHVHSHQPEASDAELPDLVAEENVRLTMDKILEESHTLRTLFEQKQINIVGGMYNVDDGKVDFFEEPPLKSESSAA